MRMPMDTMNEFLSPPKKAYYVFSVLYVIVITIIARITGSFGIRTCVGCQPNIYLTPIFYLLAALFLYVMFCWALYAWKKTMRMVKQ